MIMNPTTMKVAVKKDTGGESNRREGRNVAEAKCALPPHRLVAGFPSAITY